MLKYRLITGPILIALLLALVYVDDRLDRWRWSEFWQGITGWDRPPPGLLICGLALLVVPLAARELTTVFRTQGLRGHVWLTSVAATVGLLVSYLIPPETDAIRSVAIVATALFAVFVLSLFTFSRRHTVEGVAASAGAVLLAMVYLGLMSGFLLAIRREHSAWLIVGVILTTKASDTGAYFTGRAIGRHKMISWLSPGKTWEGLIGGTLCAMLVGAVLAWASRRWLPDQSDQIPAWLGVLAGGIFAVVGQLGDLCMSLFKRGARLKDSSHLLPGLGGVMDVLDSPLMVAPIAYWLLAAFTSYAT